MNVKPPPDCRVKVIRMVRRCDNVAIMRLDTLQQRIHNRISFLLSRPGARNTLAAQGLKFVKEQHDWPIAFR